MTGKIDSTLSHSPPMAYYGPILPYNIRLLSVAGNERKTKITRGSIRGDGGVMIDPLIWSHSSQPGRGVED